MPDLLPARLTAAQQKLLQNAIRKYAGQVSQKKLQEILDGIKAGLIDLNNPQQEIREAGQSVTVGLNPATARNAITEILNEAGIESIANKVDFTIRIASQVMQGARQFVDGNDPDVVEAYPAWALARVYDRDVPRGFKRGKGVLLVPVPDDDWPSRWAEAGDASADDDWLEWEGDSQSGRGVALKSSDIWNQLGSIRDDSLGNNFPPFAFNSGFDWNPVGAAEAIGLGLMDAGDAAKPAAFDPAKLFADIL